MLSFTLSLSLTACKASIIPPVLFLSVSMFLCLFLLPTLASLHYLFLASGAMISFSFPQRGTEKRDPKLWLTFFIWQVIK